MQTAAGRAGTTCEPDQRLRSRTRNVDRTRTQRDRARTPTSGACRGTGGRGGEEAGGGRGGKDGGVAGDGGEGGGSEGGGGAGGGGEGGNGEGGGGEGRSGADCIGTCPEVDGGPSAARSEPTRRDLYITSRATRIARGLIHWQPCRDVPL